MIFRNLVNHLPKCKKKYTFKEIIKILELPKSYNKTVDLKNKVIKIAIDEINEKTDIHVEYEYYSEGGRAHVGVIFTFWKKEGNESAPLDLPEPQELPSTSADDNSFDFLEYGEKISQEKSFTEEEQKIYDRLLKNGVLSSAAKELVEKYPLNVIERNIKLAMNLKDTIGNMGGFIVSSIKQDYMGNTESEIQKAKEREQARQDALWKQIQSDAEKKKEEIAQAKAETKQSAKIREQSQLEKIGAKKDEFSDFVFDGSVESVEKVIKIYYKNNKKCPESVLRKLEQQRLTWTNFQMEHLEMFQKFQDQK